jgi:hypothetical protein
LPTYSYRLKENYNPDVSVEEPTETFYGSWTSYEEFLKANPQYETVLHVVPGGRSSIDPIIAGRQRPERGFNDVLIEMKKKVGGRNTIKTYY